MKTLNENNKIIAEFMGLSYCKKHPYEGWYKNHRHTFRLCDFNGLKYRSDWNWLMEVVEKIHSMQSYGVLINPNGTYIQDEDGKVICITFKNEEVNGEIISSSNIEATFNCCVEFIKRYNENK